VGHAPATEASRAADARTGGEPKLPSGAGCGGGIWIGGERRSERGRGRGGADEVKERTSGGGSRTGLG
jgi:hypothetical protein